MTQVRPEQDYPPNVFPVSEQPQPYPPGVQQGQYYPMSGYQPVYYHPGPYQSYPQPPPSQPPPVFNPAYPPPPSYAMATSGNAATTGASGGAGGVPAVAVKSTGFSLGAKIAIVVVVIVVIAIAVTVGVVVAVSSAALGGNDALQDPISTTSLYPGDSSCGESYLTEPSGTISTMNYDGYSSYDGYTSYDRDSTCFWLIEAPEGQVIQLTFTYFDVGSGDYDCQYDVVTIYDGRNMAAAVLAEYCGYSLPPPVVSTGRYMYVYFTSDWSYEYAGFLARYQAVNPQDSGCGGESHLTGLSGSFSSLNYDGTTPYDNNLFCQWVIEVSAGEFIHIEFLHVSIEYSSSCEYDVLTIYDGRDDSHDIIGTYCGDTLPSSVTSTTNFAYITFISDDVITEAGFELYYESVQQSDVSSGCTGDRYLTASSGVISSMNYDGSTQYDSNAYCEWLIEVEDGKVINFQFSAIDIESSGSSCPYDYVKLHDGSTSAAALLGKFCGTTLPDEVTSSSNNLLVIFQTDSSVQNTGFQASYGSSVKCPSGEFQCDNNLCININSKCDGNNDCGDNSDELDCTVGCSTQTLSSSNGTFSSPGYNGTTNYANNLDCEWNIIVDSSKVVYLTFTALSLESHSTCYYDYIGVYDGASTSSTLIINLCGNAKPAPITSSGNELTVKMRTDGSFGSTGFTATYQSQVVCNSSQIQCSFGQSASCISDSYHCDGNDDCGDGSDETGCPGESPCGGSNTLVADNGTFSTMNYDGVTLYDNNANCEWSITVSSGKVVFLQFITFSLEARGCNFDVVRVYDGPDDKATLLGHFCGRAVPEPIRSSGTQMHVTFTSDFSDQFPGFLAVYDAEVKCTSSQFRCSSGLEASCISATVQCDGNDDCPDGSDESGCPGNEANCGVPHFTPNVRRRKRSRGYQRIVGGDEAEPYSFPWQISLEYSYHGHICGGSIVNAYWVATAAHCVVDDQTTASYTVKAGEHNRQHYSATEQSRSVSTIVIHDDYNSNTIDYDIALLKVSTPFTWTNHVIPVCLPVQWHAFSAGKVCYVTGWGDTLSTGNEQVLNQVDVPLLSNTVCNQPVYLNGRITDRMLCAGYDAGGKDSCQGDSGGPLVCQDTDGKWLLSGIVSWGFGCADAYSPGVYTRTSYFIEWIEDAILNN